MKKSDLIKQIETEINSIPIPNVLEKARQQTQISVTPQTHSPARSKHSFSFRMVASFMAIMIIAFALYAAVIPFVDSSSSYSTLSIDINPSVELTLNRYEQITKVEAVNTDANALLNELNIIGDNIELAVEKLLNKAIEQGYLTEENSNAILFSVKNKKQAKVESLKQKIENKMGSYLQGRNIQNTILFEEYNEELKEEFNNIRQEFENNVNITPAKYKYIKSILQRFPILVGRVEYLANMSIMELHQLLTAPELSNTVQDLIEQIIQNAQNNNGAIGGTGRN